MVIFYLFFSPIVNIFFVLFSTLDSTFNIHRYIFTFYFRAFLMNEELTSVMNSYCCLKKIWILLLKPYNLHSCNTTNFHSHDGAMTSTVTPVWFPKPGFKPSSLAKIVNIQIQYPFKPDDLNSEQIFQPSTSTFSSEQFHSNQECGASHDLVSEHVATDRTPVRRRGGLGRRVLPSLARRLVREQEGGSSSVLDPLLQDMEQFGLSHLEVSASSPYFDNTFLKPTVPINGKSCNKKITKLRVYEKNIPDEETSLDTDFSVVDMVQTPIASDRLSNYSNKSFARSSVGSNSNFKTPFHNYPDNNSDRTCEKLIPIPMVETPIFSDKSLRFESLLATRVSSQVVSGLPHSKRWCPDPMNHTPLNSTYNHIGPFSSDKIYPISMIETPIVSQPPSDVDTPYTENDIAMSTYEKRDSAFMLKTPIETERCFRNASTHVELTTSTNVHPQSMIETPVIQGIRNILETPMAHLGLSTSKKIFPVSMIETPILTERKDIERRKNNIVEYHDYMSNSVSLIETSVALNRKIVFETPISRLVKAEQLPTGKKMDSISMTETSIDSEKMCYNSTPNQFFEDTHELPTCRKLSPQSMIGTPITSHQPNTMTYASPDNMPNNFNKPLNQASQEYEIEEDLTCANKCEPLNNYFVEDGAASTSNTCISQKSSSYIWYQLSIPLVGFTEKPVARPKVGDQQDDDDDPLDFL